MSGARSRLVLVCLGTAAAWYLSVPAIAAQSADPSLADILSAAGRYVAGYETDFGVVAADERYVQTANSVSTPRAMKREMNCAVLIFNTGESGWMAFRDVLSVDARQISNDAGRLAALAANPTNQALARAMKATEESRTYWLAAQARPIAVAPSALVFLRSSQQSRSTFHLDGMKTVGKVRVALVTFQEKSVAQMIATGETSTTGGRFWIEPGTGRVVQTELTIAAGTYTAKTEVDYASEPGLDIWVPVRLSERYSGSLPATTIAGSRTMSSPTSAYVDGLSTYSNFRRFDLKPGLVIR